MNATSIEQVNSKLKQLPESLLEEVERYIDFLTYKHNQETEFELSNEQKEILDNQENLSLTQYQDNADFLEEVKNEYGL